MKGSLPACIQALPGIACIAKEHKTKLGAGAMHPHNNSLTDACTCQSQSPRNSPWGI